MVRLLTLPKSDPFSGNLLIISMLRSVTESQKKRVAGRQRYTCAASVPDYKCQMKGEPFDESGYEIDHIKELRDGGTNDISNLQALCITCHRVKTSRMTSAMAKKNNAPKVEVHMCHHCEKYTATVFEDDKWHCEADCIRACKGTPNDGCGPRSSPNPSVFVQKLDKFRYIPQPDPPGTIRSQTVLPNGKVVYSVTHR
jgi:5-methylcytosine-specific restriction protein A